MSAKLGERHATAMAEQYRLKEQFPDVVGNENAVRTRE